MEQIMMNFYTKENCPLCEKAKLVLNELKHEFPLELNEIDIYQDDRLIELYGIMIPVVEVDGEQLGFGIIKKDEIRKRLLEKMG